MKGFNVLLVSNEPVKCCTDERLSFPLGTGGALGAGCAAGLLALLPKAEGQERTIGAPDQQAADQWKSALSVQQDVHIDIPWDVRGDFTPEFEAEICVDIHADIRKDVPRDIPKDVRITRVALHRASFHCCKVYKERNKLSMLEPSVPSLGCL